MPWLAFPTTLPSGSDKAPNLVSSGRGCDICQSSTVTTATCGLAWTWEPDAHIIHVERPRPSGQETPALHEIRGSSGRRQLAVLGRDGLGRGSCGLFSRPARVTVSRANGHPATRRPQARGRRLVVSHKLGKGRGWAAGLLSRPQVTAPRSLDSAGTRQSHLSLDRSTISLCLWWPEEAKPASLS